MKYLDNKLKSRLQTVMSLIHRLTITRITSFLLDNHYYEEGFEPKKRYISQCLWEVMFNGFLVLTKNVKKIKYFLFMKNYVTTKTFFRSTFSPILIFLGYLYLKLSLFMSLSNSDSLSVLDFFNE